VSESSVTATRFVIVGGGFAGAKAAEELREQGYDGSLTIVGDELHLPYERPPLSKEYLAGSATRDSLDVHDADWYRDHHVDLRLGTAAETVDAATHEVALRDGAKIGYDKLLLATGSHARQLSIPGSRSHDVFTLRTVDDSDRIDDALADSDNVAIIGGGWIGMEIAANARGRGAEVTVIEAARYPLGAALGPELAQVFVDLHQQQGVTFHSSATVSEITADEAGRATGVRLADGTSVGADVVVVGIGAQPNLELAESAGLDINDGVLVDESLQSSDPDICAVGDIANHAHPVLGQRVRVEHWANALNQPAAAAATMLGNPTPYTELPYFFTDQYDLGMECHGHAPPGSYARTVVRGDRGGREFIAFWLDAHDHVLAGMNVNVWDVGDDIKALILAGKPVDADRLADPGTPLTDLV